MQFPRWLAGLFIGLVATGCATTPALHVIGIYEGQTPHGVDEKQWGQRCLDDLRDKYSNVVTSSSMEECNRKYSEYSEKEIVVKVSDDRRPIVLALMAVEPTLWKVSLNEGVELKKVILAGYRRQRVSGIQPETLVETYTYETSPCDRCWQSANYLDSSYEVPPGRLREITGLEVTSFQGRYRGAEFSIFPGIEKAPRGQPLQVDTIVVGRPVVLSSVTREISLKSKNGELTRVGNGDTINPGDLLLVRRDASFSFEGTHIRPKTGGDRWVKFE